MPDYLGKDTKKLGFGLMRLPHKGPFTDVEQLLDEVWHGEDAGTDTVWMYVSFLHGKLQSVQANVTIDGGREQPFRLREIDDV